MMDYNEMKTTQITLSLMDLKNLFLEGREHGVEEMQVDTMEIEEDDMTAKDFGEYMLQTHNIKID